MVWDSTIAGGSLFRTASFACASFLVAFFAEEVGGSFISLLLPSPPSFAVFGFFFFWCLGCLCAFALQFSFRFYRRKFGRVCKILHKKRRKEEGEGRRRKVRFRRRRIRAHDEEEEEEEVGHYTNNVFRGRR